MGWVDKTQPTKTNAFKKNPPVKKKQKVISLKAGQNENALAFLPLRIKK